MLPEDAVWHEDSGNEPIAHEFVNALELGVDVGLASENAAAIFPAPTGTTLQWGGVKMVFLRSGSLANGASTEVDHTFDWRNRWVMVLDWGCDSHEADIPGEVGYTASGTHDLDATAQTPASMWTGAGAVDGAVPVGNYITLAVNHYLYCNSVDNHLNIRNSGAGALYYWLVLLVSDQFKTRLP